MGRLIGWILGAPLAGAVVIFAVSNRALVVADLWPLPWAVQAPLYLFVLVALVVGFLVGYLIAWAGGLAARRRIRAEARARPWTADSMSRQNAAAGSPSTALPAPPPV